MVFTCYQNDVRMVLEWCLNDITGLLGGEEDGVWLLEEG
jgi:hypothetical protein